MNKKIQEHFDKMYEGEKSQKFMIHLLRAYIPVSNVEKIWGAPMRNFRCCISEKPLTGGNTRLEELKDGKRLLNYMAEPFTDENITDLSAPKEFFKNKELGVKGKDTKTYMSVAMFGEFYQWVLIKVLEDDNGVYKAIGQYTTVGMLKNVEAIAESDKDKKRIKSSMKKIETSNQEKAKSFESYQKREAEKEEQKTTLGDIFGGLEELKAKLD